MSTVEARIVNLAGSAVHQQYARKADLKSIMGRLVSALPSAFVQYNHMYFTLIRSSFVYFHLLQ